MVLAIKEARVHHEDFIKFNDGVESYCGPVTVTSWLDSVHAWEADHSKPSPYEVELQGKRTLQDVELELA